MSVHTHTNNMLEPVLVCLERLLFINPTGNIYYFKLVNNNITNNVQLLGII